MRKHANPTVCEEKSRDLRTDPETASFMFKYDLLLKFELGEYRGRAIQGPDSKALSAILAEFLESRKSQILICEFSRAGLIRRMGREVLKINPECKPRTELSIGETVWFSLCEIVALIESV